MISCVATILSVLLLGSDNENLEQDLVGIWSGLSDGPSESTFLKDETSLNSDGTVLGIAELWERGPPELRLGCLRVSGRWEVEDKIIRFSDLQFSHGQRHDLVENRILTVDRNLLHFVEPGSEKVHVRRRVPRNRIECAEADIIGPPLQTDGE